ncbi:MAG: hypothetical protein H6745_22580 [Deltaproteobacteria bacterium]|nr:hypothetical protein [Deltaproteobacteria bacterium]
MRALAALDALAARRALTAEEQALRLDLLTRVPLGLRDADLDAALDATPRLEVGDPALAIRLLNRGRPADLGKLTDAAGARRAGRTAPSSRRRSRRRARPPSA